VDQTKWIHLLFFRHGKHPDGTWVDKEETSVSEMSSPLLLAGEGASQNHSPIEGEGVACPESRASRDRGGEGGQTRENM
jgi:hypothetical protein